MLLKFHTNHSKASTSTMATPKATIKSPTSAGNVKGHIRELEKENKEIVSSILPLQNATVSLKRKLEELDRAIPDVESKRIKWFDEKTEVQEELEKVDKEQHKLDIRRAELDNEKKKHEGYEKAASKELTDWTALREETVGLKTNVMKEDC